MATIPDMFEDWSSDVPTPNSTNCTSWNSTSFNGTAGECDTTPVSFELNWFRLIVLIPSCVVILICSCVLIILLKLPELRNVTNALIINATMTDLFRGFIGLTNTYMYIRPLPVTDFHYVLCKIFLFCHLFQGFWSSWSMCALAYDRYDLLAHPVQRKLKGKHVAVALLMIFLFGAFLCCLPLLGWSEFLSYRLPENPDLFKCRLSQQETNTADWAFLPTFDFCAFILPCIVNIVIYGKMVHLVVFHTRSRQPAPSNLVVHYKRSTEGSTNTTSITTQDDAGNGNRTLTRTPRSTTVRPQSTTTPLEIIKSKAFRLVTAVVITNMALTLPLVIVVEMEKFRVIIIKVFPDVMKSILVSIFHFNFVFNAVVYIFWVRNTVRIIANKTGFRRGGLLIRFIRACCIKKNKYYVSGKRPE